MVPDSDGVRRIFRWSSRATIRDQTKRKDVSTSEYCDMYNPLTNPCRLRASILSLVIRVRWDDLGDRDDLD